MRLFSCICLCLIAAVVVAAPRTPGKLRVVEAKGGNEEIVAQVPDVIELRIANPALPVMVSDIEIEADGAAVFVGLADTSPEGLPGGGRLSVFITLKGGVRSGTVNYSYKNSTGTVKGKLTIQVGKGGQ